MGETARLIVERNSERDIKMRGLQVFLDDVFVTDLEYSRSVEKEIDLGHHVLKVTNNLYTKTLEFDAILGEDIRFSTGNHASGLSGMLILTIGIGPYKVFLERI